MRINLVSHIPHMYYLHASVTYPTHLYHIYITHIYITHIYYLDTSVI